MTLFGWALLLLSNNTKHGKLGLPLSEPSVTEQISEPFLNRFVQRPLN